MTVDLSPRLVALAIAIALVTAVGGVAVLEAAGDGSDLAVEAPAGKPERVAGTAASARTAATSGAPPSAAPAASAADDVGAPARPSEDPAADAGGSGTTEEAAPAPQSIRSTGTSAAPASERATATLIPAPVVTAPSTSTSTSAPTTTTSVLTLDRDVAARVVAHHNRERAGRGLPPLTRSSCLDAVAGAWATRLASNGQLAHNPSSPAQSETCLPWRAIGENVGYDGTVEAITDAWMASLIHRTNILSGSFTQVGVGVVRKDGSLWVAVNFAG